MYYYINKEQQQQQAKMVANKFSVKSHKFKANRVIISELEETANKNPVFRFKYDYEGGVGVGPLNIQLSPMIAKMGVTGMNGAEPGPITKDTNDSISLSFSDNENYTTKEKIFLKEFEKFEELFKEKVAKYACNIFDGIDEGESPEYVKKFVSGKYGSLIQYSTAKDKDGKKTKKRDGKYTSMRPKMYKNENEQTGVCEYQGRFIPFDSNEVVVLTIDNHEEIIQKWSEIKPIISINSAWVMAKVGFGLRCTPNLFKVLSVSEGYGGVEIEEDSDEEDSDPKSETKVDSKDVSTKEITEKLDNVELKEDSSDTESKQAEEDLEEDLEEESDDDLEIKEPPKVVNPAPKSRRVTPKK